MVWIALRLVRLWVVAEGGLAQQSAEMEWQQQQQLFLCLCRRWGERAVSHCRLLQPWACWEQRERQL
jgi:hypothetical protein